MTPHVVRSHVWVSGIVQGVYFRASTAEAARTLGVSGWARNLPDGRVEAVFEGDDALVAQMVQWCWTGSPSSVVESVEAVAEPAEGLQGFATRW